MEISNPKDYSSWLAGLKEQIRTSRVKASLAVNRELVLLYWRIGKEIFHQRSVQSGGAKVLDQLVKDLKAEFPDMRGLSLRNMQYMRAFSEAWPDEAIVQQLAAQLPWFQNCLVLDKGKDHQTREWY